MHKSICNDSSTLQVGIWDYKTIIYFNCVYCGVGEAVQLVECLP